MSVEVVVGTEVLPVEESGSEKKDGHFEVEMAGQQ